MKTLVKGNLSIYLFDDNKEVVVTNESITVGNPIEFVVSDCNDTNTTMYENIIAPVDWVGGKYFFDGTDWTLNPDWVDPSLPV